MKAEDLEKFKHNHNQRVKKNEQKKKDEDFEKFKHKHNQRVKKNEQKKKADNPESFQENLKERKRKSRSMTDVDDRLKRFRNRVKYGPIFVCSCCHQKLFQNQVEEFTDKLKEEIDSVNPLIRADCIQEKIEVDLGRDEDGLDINKVFVCKSCKKIIEEWKMSKIMH